MQQLINAIKADLADMGAVVDFDAALDRLFPGRTDLTSAEYILLLRVLHRKSHYQYNFDPYIAAVQEAGSAERTDKLCGAIQENGYRSFCDMVWKSWGQMLAPASGLSADGQKDLPADTTDKTAATTSDDDKTLDTTSVAVDASITPPRDLRKEIDELQKTPEAIAWHRTVDGIDARWYAYFIHVRRFDLLEYSMGINRYFKDKHISAKLAHCGDLDGLKWIRENWTFASNMWRTDTIIKFATIRGHLNILMYMVQFQTYPLICWKRAIDGKQLHIVQWYFVASSTAATAREKASKMLNYARNAGAGEIVAWLTGMGF